VLPFNPQHLPGLTWDLALNTAVSFVSNTNWQVDIFCRAKARVRAKTTAMPVAAERKFCTVSPTIRITLWLLLPLSLLVALFFIQQGVPQNLQAYQPFTSAVGFSNGWAELALKKPPPLVPSSLIASCEATGPIPISCRCWPSS
jgi:K+-transporting ATPase ATPase A chain